MILSVFPAKDRTHPSYSRLTSRLTGRCFLPAGRRGGSVELAVVIGAGGLRRTAGQLSR